MIKRKGGEVKGKERKGEGRRGEEGKKRGGGCHSGLIDYSVRAELSQINPVFDIERSSLCICAEIIFRGCVCVSGNLQFIPVEANGVH